MDCEKCEDLLLGELYGELDEITHAAFRRHTAGCARCAGLLAGYRATRKLVALPLEPVPEGLEDRILGAAREAQKVVPIGRKLTSALSWAGAWAMRPQTAMAALFLLMVGSTTVLLRGRAHRASSAVTVTEHGTPFGAAGDDKLAQAPAAAPTATSPAARAAAAPMAASAAPRPSQPSGDLLAEAQLDSDSNKAEKKADEEGRKLKAAALAEPLALADDAPAAAGKGASAGPMDQRMDPSGGVAKEDGFGRGSTAYRAKDYKRAQAEFDQGAASGDRNAALWSARSVKAHSGCGAAVARFDALAGTQDGVAQEALFEAAECHRALGNFDAARSRYQQLVPIAAFTARAQAGLDAMHQIAARKAAPAATHAPAAPAAPPAAAARPAAKPATAVDADKASPPPNANSL